MKRVLLATTALGLFSCGAHADPDYQARGLAAKALKAATPYQSVLSRAPTVNDDNTTVNCIPGISGWLFNNHYYSPISCGRGAANWIEISPSGPAIDVLTHNGYTNLVAYGTMNASSVNTNPMGVLESPLGSSNPGTVTLNFTTSGTGDYTTADQFSTGVNAHSSFEMMYDQGPLNEPLEFGEGVTSLATSSSTGSFSSGATLTFNTPGCTATGTQPCYAPTAVVQTVSAGVPTKFSLLQFGFSATGFTSPLTMASCTPSNLCGSALQATPTLFLTGDLWEANSGLGASRARISRSLNDPRGNQTAIGTFGVNTSFVYHPGAFTHYSVLRVHNSSNTSIAIEGPNNVGGKLYYDFFNNSGPPAITTNGNAGNNCPVTVEASNAVLTVTANGASTTCQSNNAYGTGSFPSQVINTGFDLGTISNSGNETRVDRSMDILVNAVVTPAVSLEVQAALSLQFKVPPQRDGTDVDIGDSMCAGTGPLYGNDALRNLAYGAAPNFSSMLTRQIRLVNMCISGTTAQQTLASLQSGLLTNVYSVLEKQFIVSMLTFPNDIRLNDTPAATIIATLKSIVSFIHGLSGSSPDNTAVIDVGPALQCDIYQSVGAPYAPVDALSNFIFVYNYLRSDATLPASSPITTGTYVGYTGLGAQGFADFNADTYFGPGNFTSSAYCGYPNAITPDGQHGTDQVIAIMARIRAAVTNAILALITN